MSVARCPRCAGILVQGVLRCRFCGADARAAPAQDDGLVLELDDEACADVARLLEARRRLREIAPALFAWYQIAPRARGPEPAVHPRHRAEVAELLRTLT